MHLLKKEEARTCQVYCFVRNRMFPVCIIKPNLLLTILLFRISTTKDVTYYVYNESEGEQNEDHLNNLYHDGYGYQNRISVLSNALFNLALLHNITMEQKYLTKTHTQMEVDSVHSQIERQG